ncbi:MAG: 5-(carboxyamino)imidazole ribonucleotide mutase [Clostridia bacterium]
MKVAIVMGSDSDLPIMQKSAEILKQFGVQYSMRIYSAHRTPDEARQFAQSARQEGYGVIIAGAGKAAHLAGALASQTILPIIGIPIKASTLDGVDALFSTVMMPSGVPVATVAIDGAVNAALLAIQILALSDTALADKLLAYKEEARQAVIAKNNQLNNL